MMRPPAAGERFLQFRYLRFLLVVSALHGCLVQTVSAADYTILTAPPVAQAQTPAFTAPAPQPGAVARGSVILPVPTAGAKPADQLQVEAALGMRDLSRDYLRFSAVFPPGAPSRPGFAEFVYGQYAAKRRSGIVLAGIVAPIIAGMTVMGSLLLYNHGKEDGGGFCNNTWDDNSYNDCYGDNGELSGIIIISTLGSIAVIATFTPGIVKAAKYNKRMGRLAPLVPEAGLSVGLGPGGFSARLVF